MPVRLAVVAASCVCLLSTAGVHAQSQKAVQKRLASGTRLSLVVSDKALSKTVERINKISAGCRIEVRQRDSFFGRSVGGLNAKHSFRFNKTPFWEVVQTIADDTELRMTGIENGAVVLSRSFFRSSDQPNGERVLSGAFLAIPQLGFGGGSIRILPEPWVQSASMRSYTVSFDIPGKGTLSIDRPNVQYPDRSGEFTIHNHDFQISYHTLLADLVTRKEMTSEEMRRGLEKHAEAVGVAAVLGDFRSTAEEQEGSNEAPGVHAPEV